MSLKEDARQVISFRCAHCGETAVKATGAVNRAKRQGATLYCNRVCSWLGRRKHKTAAQKKNEKRLYDEEYRSLNRVMLKAKKATYFQETYDPAKAAIERKKRAHLHADYCRTPEYRAWKKEYDRRHRAGEFGPYADAYLLLLDLDRELDARASWHERVTQKGTVNKTQRRKRDYEQLISHQS